jgi:hypothetical protein
MLSLLLLAGLAINLAVAWVCALSATDDSGERGMALRVADVRRWIDVSPGAYMLQFGRSRLHEGTGVLRITVEPDEPPKPQRWHRVSSLEAGLPLPAFSGEVWTHHADGISSASRRFEAAITPASIGMNLGAADDRLLPLRPILPGTLTNTILFAIVIWALWRLPGLIRFLVRVRRGSCARCHAPLPAEQLGPCSRCGWQRAIAVRKPQATL